MRPVELTLEGFRSYREQITFSFDQRGLFGIVGPTGSGKSSILDGLIYALYGETPRVKRSTKSLINTRDDQARVHLTFEVADKLWEVTRVLRRSGASKVVLHPRDDKSAPIEGEGNVTAHIQSLVGLDADAFCSSVSLPQGDFDRFLRATPATRTQILKGIFRLERVDAMKAEAMQRLGEIDGRLAVTMASISLPEEPERLLADLKAAAAKADSLVGDIKAALPLVRKSEQELGSTLVAIAGLDERLVEIKSSISVLPSAPDLERLVEEHGSAKRAVADAEEKSTAADEAETTARQLFEQIEQQMGGQKWFTDVDRVMQEGNRVISDMAALEKRMVEDQQIVETMVPQVEALQRKYIEAEAQLISARQALHQAHIDDSAGVIRSTLSKDQPCPVCEQIVKSLPASQASPNVKSSESAVVHAEKAAASSRSELEEAGKRKGIAENRVQVTKGDLDEIKVRVADISVALAGLVGTADPTVELKRRQDLLDGARTTHTESAKLRQAASAAAATSRKTLQVVEASVAKVTSVLDRACGLLRVTRSTDDLGGTCKLVLDAAASIEVDLSRQVVALKEQRQQASDIIEGFRLKFAAVSGTADEVLAEAVVAHSTAVRAVHDLEQVISKAKEAEALSLVLRKEKANYERLKMDFSDAKFLTYLLEKQRKILSQLASDKFFELTGCYTFDSDGEFQIIDVRTGDTRAPDTLSGGETFLASLALALALAEAVALGGARLDCFFLDEGFGSLDRESLDLAMQGIENLAQPGRLIGVISHIPGIQQALDDLIVLDKSQDGTTVVIQHEGPIGYEPMLI